MPRPPRLIAELVTLTRPWGWTIKDLARELGLSDITLTQLRSGRRRVSFDTFSHIADKFGDHPIIKATAWQYARDYYKKQPPSTGDVLPLDLPPGTSHALRRYIDTFADEVLHDARGLFLLSADTAFLTAAISYLRRAFEAKDVRVTVLRADAKPAAADQRAALVTPLLIVERVEFLHPVVADLLRRRDDVLKPVIVTSTTEPSATADEYLRRVFLSRMRRIEIATGAPTTAAINPSTHAGT
jgi:transcriptional regulator with XRE-family HTH domain